MDLIWSPSYGPFTQSVGVSFSIRGNANANAQMGTTAIHFAAEVLLLTLPQTPTLCE